MQKALLLFVFISTSLLATAQTGSITGTIVDAKTQEAIIGASVLVEGTQIGTSTDIEGKFILKNVPAGTQAVIVSYVTYKTQTYSNITVVAGQATEITVSLAEESTELEEVVITGKSDKSDEMVLLRDRKKSIDIVQNIGAQELSRKGVSNAEAAVTQLTGVSKQEGVKNVFIRGLGDRYNSTSMNGLPLPSEDPQLKNIALTFFSTDVINNIEVNKTFNPRLYGDVAGANVNIISKDLVEDQELSFSGSIGTNWQTVSQDFYRADGNNMFGKVDKDVPVSNLSNYSFNNSLKPSKLSGPLLNHGLALAGGKTFMIGNNPLKVFAVASSIADFLYTEGRVSQTSAAGDVRQDLKFKRYEYNVSQFALTNANYTFANKTTIGYNVFYVHSNRQFIGDYTGYSQNGIDDTAEPNAYDNVIVRQQTNDNTLLVNQLVSNIQLTSKLSLDVRGSFNTIRGNEPDRRTNFYIKSPSEDSYYANNNSPAYNHRFFSELKENEFAGNAELVYKLNSKSPNNKISLGYNYRLTDRDFSFLQFNFNNRIQTLFDPANPDTYFNQQNIDNGTFIMETNRGDDSDALKPLYYTADRAIHGAMVRLDYELSPKLSLTAGARFETVNQDVVWSVAADIINEDLPNDNTVNRNDNYLLPSFSLKYNLTENDQLRLAGSKTYTYPQFKEVAPFLYEDVNENVFGNTELRPAENLNLDLRYEHYFVGDGLIAITGFYKHITDAINMVQVNSAALEYSYLNTGDANVIGAELEIKRNIVNFSTQSYLSGGLNVSYLYSNQQLKNDPDSKVQFIPTHDESALEGAAPWLVGADLTYNYETEKSKISSGLVLSYFSKRIYSLGVTGQDNIYERGIPKLDWISKIGLSSKFTLNINIRNMLNPEYRLTKQVLPDGKTDLIRSYTRGVSSSIGFTYKF